MKVNCLIYKINIEFIRYLQYKFDSNNSIEKIEIVPSMKTVSNFFQQIRRRPKIRLSKLEEFINKNKSSRGKQNLKPSHNLIDVREPFYLTKRWQNHNLKTCPSECVGCLYKKKMQGMKQKVSNNKNLIFSKNKHPPKVLTEGVYKRQPYLSQMYKLKRIGQSFEMENKNSQKAQRDKINKVMFLEKQIKNTLFGNFQSYNLSKKQVHEIDKVFKKYIMEQLHHKAIQDQQCKQFPHLLNQTDSKYKDQIKKIHEVLSYQQQIPYSNNFLIKTNMLMKHVQNILNKNKKIVQVKVASKFNKNQNKKNQNKKNKITKQNIRRKIIDIIPQKILVNKQKVTRFLQSDCQNQQLYKIADELVLTQYDQFKNALKCIDQIISNKVVGQNQQENVYNIMVNRIKIIQKQIYKVQKVKSRNKKKKIIDKYLKMMIKRNNKNQEQNQQIQNFEKYQLSQQQSENISSIKTNRSLYRRKKQSHSSLGIDSSQLSDDFSQASFGNESIKRSIINIKNTRSSKILMNTQDKMQNMATSLRNVSQIDVVNLKLDGVHSKNNSKRTSKKKSENEGESQFFKKQNIAKIRKPKQNYQNKQIIKKNQKRTHNRYHQLKPSHFPSQVQTPKRDQKKGNLNIIAKQRLNSHKDLISYAQKYLKSASLQSLIIHEHNGIFMKKKKIRQLKELLTNKFMKQQVDQSILNFLQQYLLIYQQNCMIRLGKKNSNKIHDEQNGSLCKERINLLRNKDYFKKLIFYQLAQNFDLQNQVDEQFTFQRFQQTQQLQSCQQIETNEIKNDGIDQNEDNKQLPELVQIAVDSKMVFSNNTNDEQDKTRLSYGIENKLEYKYQHKQQLFPQDSVFWKVSKLLKKLQLSSSQKT